MVAIFTNKRLPKRPWRTRSGAPRLARSPDRELRSRAIWRRLVLDLKGAVVGVVLAPLVCPQGAAVGAAVRCVGFGRTGLHGRRS
jgi:hypothetical protein